LGEPVLSEFSSDELLENDSDSKKYLESVYSENEDDHIE
jgi:hypothetical protein